jgi:hypothetical protein
VLLRAVIGQGMTGYLAACDVAATGEGELGRESGSWGGGGGDGGPGGALEEGSTPSTKPLADRPVGAVCSNFSCHFNFGRE